MKKYVVERFDSETGCWDNPIGDHIEADSAEEAKELAIEHLKDSLTVCKPCTCLWEIYDFDEEWDKIVDGEYRVLEYARW